MAAQIESLRHQIIPSSLLNETFAVQLIDNLYSFSFNGKLKTEN